VLRLERGDGLRRRREGCKELPLGGHGAIHFDRVDGNLEGCAARRASTGAKLPAVNGADECEGAEQALQYRGDGTRRSNLRECSVWRHGRENSTEAPPARRSDDPSCRSPR